MHYIFQKPKIALPAQTQWMPVHQLFFSSLQLCGTQLSPKWFNAVPFKMVFISKKVFTPRPWRSQKKFILSVLVQFIFCSIAYRIFVSVGQHYLQLQLSPQLGVTPWFTLWSHKPGFNIIYLIGNKESCSTDKALLTSSGIPLVTCLFFFLEGMDKNVLCYNHCQKRRPKKKSTSCWMQPSCVFPWFGGWLI